MDKLYFGWDYYNYSHQPDISRIIEEKFEDFDPNVDFDDYLMGIDEQTEPYQQFSKKTYRVFIKKLGKQGPNKYNVGGKMKKPSSKHLKSGPPGG